MLLLLLRHVEDIRLGIRVQGIYTREVDDRQARYQNLSAVSAFEGFSVCLARPAYVVLAISF